MTNVPRAEINPVDVKLVINVYSVPLIVNLLPVEDQSTHESPYPSNFKLRVVVCGQSLLIAPLNAGLKVVATDPLPT